MLTRWHRGGLEPDPFTTLESLRRRMDRLFEDFNRGFGWQGTEPLAEVSAWPRVDVYDTDEAVVVRADLPGVEQNDLEVTLNEESLTLRGKRRVEAPPGYEVHRRERGDITFTRAFTLPAKVDADQVSAELKNGVLTLTLEKTEEARAKRIRVSTN